MKKIALLILWLYYFFPHTAAGVELVVYQEGDDLIRGYLPESWNVIPEKEVGSFISNKEQLASEQMKMLAGYRLDGSSDASAMLFVFYSQPGERISWEQREKMYSWFKGNTGLMSEILPENMQGITLENIEYLQDRDTVLFESKVEIGGTALSGVNGIVFLRLGYLDIAGYTTEGAREPLDDFYKFIKTLSVSSELQYTQKETLVINRKLFQDYWQKFLGGVIFVFVYGVTFLNKDRNKFAVRSKQFAE
jgi:hypothetical protein